MGNRKGIIASGYNAPAGPVSNLPPIEERSWNWNFTDNLQYEMGSSSPDVSVNGFPVVTGGDPLVGLPYKEENRYNQANISRCMLWKDQSRAISSMTDPNIAGTLYDLTKGVLTTDPTHNATNNRWFFDYHDSVEQNAADLPLPNGQYIRSQNSTAFTTFYDHNLDNVVDFIQSIIFYYGFQIRLTPYYTLIDHDESERHDFLSNMSDWLYHYTETYPWNTPADLAQLPDFVNPWTFSAITNYDNDIIFDQGSPFSNFNYHVSNFNELDTSNPQKIRTITVSYWAKPTWPFYDHWGIIDTDGTRRHSAMKFYGPWFESCLNDVLFNNPQTSDQRVAALTPVSFGLGNAVQGEANPTIIQIQWIFQNAITPAAGKTTKAQVESAVLTPGVYNLIDHFEDCTHCKIAILPGVHHEPDKASSSWDLNPRPTIETNLEITYGTTGVNTFKQMSYNFQTDTFIYQSPNQVSQTGHLHHDVLDSGFLYSSEDRTRNRLGVIPKTLYLTDSTGT